MKTTIGINVITKTAKEQDQLLWNHCKDNYNSIIPDAREIIAKYTDCVWDINSDTVYLKKGEVSNIILFVFWNRKWIEKRALRAELKKYIDAKFKHVFNAV